MQTFLISLILFLLQSFCQAATNPYEIKEFNECTFCSFKIGLKAQSLTENRGIIVDPNAQIMPGVAAYFFNNQLEVLPTSASFFHYIDDPNLRLRYRLYQVTDKPVIKLQNLNSDDYIHRENSMEAQIRIEAFWGGNSDDYVAEIDLSYAKDLKVHWGDYFEILAKFKLEEYTLEKYNLNLEPNFFTSIGWGSSSHNQYLYGSSAKLDHINNYAYGIWLAIPNRADRYYPIIMLKKFGTLSSEIGNSEYSRFHNDGVAVSLIYSTVVF